MADPIVGQPATPATGVTITAAPQGQPTQAIQPTARPPKRNPKLTHEEMQGVIRSGGSILHEGQVITNLNELPDAADLARGDIEKEAAVRDSLDAQIAALQHQKSRMTTDTGDKSKDLTGKPKA